MIWAINLITQAKNTGKIKLDPPILASLQSGFENIEAQNRKLLNYSWVNYPLPYTQVIQNYKSQGISYDQEKFISLKKKVTVRFSKLAIYCNGIHMVISSG